jgi:uncharacterized OsmC-like protein
VKRERDLKDIVSRRIAFFRGKPDAAIYRPKVSSLHIINLYTETMVREHLVKCDYAEAAGGDNLAPNPIELLLTAFAACVESAFYEFAVHEGYTINKLSVEVEGEIDLRGLFMVDESVSAGFRDIRYNFLIESPDNKDELRGLAEKVIAHCPVVDSLLKPTDISGQITVSERTGYES